MKKVLFLIVTLVCAVTGAWAADLSVNTVDGVLTITSVNKDQLKDYNSFSSEDKAATKLVLDGKFSENDLKMIYPSGSDFNFVSIDISEVTEELGKIKFGKYASTLQEVVLPASAIADNFDQNDFWSNNKCENLTKVTSGETYAEVYKDGGNMRAKVYCTSDEEYERMRLILSRCNFVDYNNNFTKIISQSDTDTDYIRFNETTKVYDVLVTSTGKFTSLFNNLSSVPADAVFHFESGCTNIGADDLALLSGSDTNGKYYIDLYDVPTSEDLENVISSAVGKMANNNNKCKGLLLPKNPTGVGTMLICNGSENVNKGKATCGEFIAYHNNGTTMAHIYFADPQNSANPTYEERLQKLKSIMDTHLDENGSKVIEAATSVYGISTNKYTEITNIIGIINDADATVVHTYDNELVKSLSTGHDKPSVVATLKTGGHLSEIFNNTGIQKTPNIDKLKLSGSVSAEDILAINSITTNGPDVLDLSNVTTSITSEMLAQLNNPYIEYIILPAGLTEPVRDYTSLTKLKCVISSNKSGDDSHVLTAYVREAGSLAKARCLATGNDDTNNNSNKPTTQGLTTVKLSGNLNANDIAVSGDTSGLRGENSITSLDLSGAYFANINHMNFGSYGAGYTNGRLSELKLPTHDEITEIPERCLYGVSSLTSLHIPYNYTKIGWEAFWESGINHITAEDANHALIDNGPHTYTFAASMTELGKPGQGEGSAVFPGSKAITDVYCLGSKAPKCYAHTFHADIVYGNGGSGDGPYCRDKYIKSADQVIAVLHYPSQESFNNASVKDDSGDYDQMVDKYTDQSRAFTKMDQTGAVDANGEPLIWPDQVELLAARTSANAGYIWTDYNFSYASNHLEGFTAKEDANQKDFYPDYVGWHEFVLSQATYVKPDEHVVDDVVYNYYVDAGWYTICIPFDLSYNDVVKMLGVPKSTAKEKSYIVENGVARETEETDDLMPDIRQLLSVERKKGSGSQNNEIVFRLTTNLALPSEHTANYLDFSEGKVVSPMPKAKKEGESADNPTCMVGGRPYIIKAYKRTYKNGESFVDETIPSQNIGLYILKHYADDFKESASCLNNEGYYEQLNKYSYTLSDNQYSVSKTEDGGETMKFAKPYENHKVQAVNGGEDAGELTFTEGDNTKRYYYTMVGQFWDQNLPQYSVYMSKGKWYRYTDPSRNYKWAAYKCVIMATPEVDQEAINNFTDDDLPDAEEVMDQIWTSSDAKPAMPKIPVASLQPGGNFRYFKNCFFPMNMPGTSDLISAPLKLAFFGRDDHDFNVPGHHQVGFPAPTRYMFVLDGDEEVVEYDENGNAVTDIATLDGETQGTAGTSKVYNLSGQYVGNSTEGLSKGIYIVDGRKIVVD